MTSLRVAARPYRVYGMGMMLDHVAMKHRREELGFSIEKAAQRAGFKSKQQWHEIEAGGKDVRLSTVSAIAVALEMDPKDLLKLKR